jgi:SAM-dependent methyltransferase
MDVVIANQVFEHLKNVWLPMSEIHRVTRTHGWLVISVPNLGSLHNRLLMLFGGQPTSIRTFGPHVRGFVAGELVRFVTYESAWRIERRLGVGFYPLPARIARPLARAWVAASHTTVLLARKPPGAPAAPWWTHTTREAQTFYAPDAVAEGTRVPT